MFRPKTTRKEKEQLIRELTKNKGFKEFSYITSHNLRAPLSNLTGLLSLIEDIPIEDQNYKKSCLALISQPFIK
jgi:light-regulated signal transduction histidine kinase (bacteriophytochrome)